MESKSEVRRRVTSSLEHDTTHETNAVNGKKSRDAIKKKTFLEFLESPIDGTLLALFRIYYALCLVVHLHKITTDRTFEANFGDDFPQINFRYYFAKDIPKPSLANVYLIGYIALGSAVLIALGLLYRLASITFFVTFVYLNLLEKTRYNNHYYLYAIVFLLFIFIDAHARLSLDSLIWRRKWKSKVPQWHLCLLQFPLVVCYFYGFIAKTNYDWLIRGEPCKTWFSRVDFIRAPFEIFLPSYMVNDAIGYFFSITGWLFDGLIGFMLLYPKTRMLGFAGTLVFHLTNHFVFRIGTFPWVMLGTNLLFLHPDNTPLVRLLSKVFRCHQTDYDKKGSWAMSKVMRVLIGIFVVTQLTIPLRHWLYKGNVNWTMEGHQFSWRMMLNEEKVLVRTLIDEFKRGPHVFTGYAIKMNRRQVKRLITDPEMLLQYVEHLKTIDLSPNHLAGMKKDPNAKITMEVWRALNNRPFQRWTNSSIDLAKTNYYAFHYDWLTEQLPDDVIDYNLLKHYEDMYREDNLTVDFFMDTPGQKFMNIISDGRECSDVRIFHVHGKIKLRMDGKSISLHQSSTKIPPNTIHKVKTEGTEPSIWGYAYNCPEGVLHRSMMMLSLEGWAI